MKHIAYKWLIATLGVACVGLAGCQTLPTSWSDQTRGNIDDSIQASRSAESKTTVPSEVSKALLPPLEVNVPNGKVAPLDSRFDLAVSGASARQVFIGLVEGTPYDVVVHPGVSGVVTLNLKDITVPEAFNALRDAYGYEYRREGNRFYVLGREMKTRLFNVNYLNLVRRGQSNTHVGASGVGQRTNNSSSTNSASNSNNNNNGEQQSTFSGVQLETQSQNDFWKDLQAILSGLVGSEDGRRVIVNSQTGVIAVRAMPDELRMVEEYLGNTHNTVNRQVVLEAKIIEVELNDGFQTGINWSRINSHYTLGQTGGGTMLSGTGIPNPSDTQGNSGDLDPTTGVFSAISGTTASAFGGVFSIAAKFDNFAAFVELLKSQGDVQVLSSPRVSALNNQKAVIKVGGDEFFVTGVTSTPTTINNQTQFVQTFDLSSFFSGIVLDVTPQIDESGNVVLHIHPSVSTVIEKAKQLGTQGSFPLAFSTIEESDNVVRAKSGQVIVIGGLMKEATTDENASVPFLGDIPVLGYLFKHKRIARVKKELVILLKPTIMKIDQDWNDAVGESQERIKKIRVGS